MNESDGDLVVRLVVDLVKAATKPLKAQIAALEIRVRSLDDFRNATAEPENREAAMSDDEPLAAMADETKAARVAALDARVRLLRACGKELRASLEKTIAFVAQLEQLAEDNLASAQACLPATSGHDAPAPPMPVPEAQR